MFDNISCYPNDILHANLFLKTYLEINKQQFIQVIFLQMIRKVFLTINSFY